MNIRLAELRKERNLSQRELAKVIGVGTSTIAMYEIGERTPPLERAMKIAHYFGVTVEELFFNKTAHSKGANNPASA